MGGDHAPGAVVEGAAMASLGKKDVEIILVGETAQIGRVLADVRHDAERMRIHHAPHVVRMDEKPAEALAAHPEASITVAAELVAAGEADALVSAGNTGASVLSCARHFKLI